VRPSRAPELAVRNLPLGQRHHPRALVEADHLSVASGQFRGVQYGAASGVQHPPAGEITQQRQACRSVVMGVVDPIGWVSAEVVGKHFVLRRITHLTNHPPILAAAGSRWG